MSQLSSFLSNANIFKNYIAGKHTSVAVKANSQIFSASSNVVKTGPLYHQRNFYKVVNYTSHAPFEVNQLVLNHNETLLAVVGESNITIVDVKDPVDFDSSKPVWDCFDVSITLPLDSKKQKPRIVSVLWHPATSKNSELVVLTKDSILVYDIVFSLTQSMLSLSLDEYPQLKDKTVSSIAFGSSSNFAGSITLYLSTTAGQIFAIYPFAYKSFTLSANKTQLTSFISDWDTVLQEYDAKLPPASAFASYRAVFTKHSEFVDSLRAKLASPLFSEAEDLHQLSFHLNINYNLNLLGPLAITGPDAKLIQASSEGPLSVLASIHKDKTGTTVVSHLSQIIPLSIAIEKPSPFLSEPQKPVRKVKQEKEVHYSKPARGFGYIIDSDGDSDDDVDDFEQQMRIYHEEVGFFNTKRKINAFIDATFNKLTVVSSDSTDLKYAKNTFHSFQRLDDSKILMASGNISLIGDSKKASSTLLNPDLSTFDVSYKLIECGSVSTSFAYVKDTIEGSGEYLIACSPSNATEVFQVENFATEKSAVSVGSPNFLLDTNSKQHTRSTALSVNELHSIKAEEEGPLPSIKGVDFTQFESLKLVQQVTSNSMRKVATLTKFVVVLQKKLELQFEDLALQVTDLSSVTAKTADKDIYIRNHERISNLIARQSRLIEREESLRNNVVERFEALRAQQKLPLSNAEREWFKELNVITEKVALGKGKTPSLTAQLEILRAKVEGIKEKNSKPAPAEDLERMLSSLSLGTNLSRIAMSLSSEGHLLSHSRRTLDSCLSRVQETLEA